MSSAGVSGNIYDAQYGRTAGGVANVSIKPGTNTFYGAAYEYLRNALMNANLFSANAAGSPRAQHPIDQYGWVLDGPVRIPEVYNGKDRTFFIFAQERYHEWVPQPVIETVPTALQRVRDFSQAYKSATHCRLQVRFSAFNTFNAPIFGSPNTSPSSSFFGKITLSQTNLPRNAELGVRYVF